MSVLQKLGNIFLVEMHLRDPCFLQSLRTLQSVRMKLPSPEFSVHIDPPMPLAMPFGTCSLNFCGACRLGAAFLPLWDTVKERCLTRKG